MSDRNQINVEIVPIQGREAKDRTHETLPDILPVLPITNSVIFPGMLIPLIVNTPKSVQLIDDVAAGNRYFIASLQRDRNKDEEDLAAQDLYETGCLTRIIKMVKFPDESIRMLAQGAARCEVEQFLTEEPYLTGKFKVTGEKADESVELEALMRFAVQRFQDIIALSPSLPDELKIAAANIERPENLADLIAANLNISLEEKQKLLEENNPKARLEALTSMLNHEKEVLELGSQIQDKVNESMSKNQRDFFLREQMKAIKKELGEDDPQQADRRELEDKVKKAHLPDHVQEIAEKELGRLLSIPAASPEYAVIRTYLDWLTELPWSQRTEDEIDIQKAQNILNQDHYDLEKIKDRILEYLAVLKLQSRLKGPILCFAGPPGVGKTSLGQSIARALGRKFIRMSLGGVHDEAEIRGHRRTYIGALPGRIIQGLRKAGTNNPVFMLDEIDKIGSDFRGDPSSALLEVLDPEQNSTFSDHYLDVEFDLSGVLFITTANMLDTIPPPLRDRMEILTLSGYTLNEKTQIAQKYLVPKQIKEHGLKRSLVRFHKKTIEQIISGYTREAGVRNLEREIANVCRKIARGVAEGKGNKISVAPEKLPVYLGPVQFEENMTERLKDPGIVIGLAWTPVGGDILFIEASKMPGKGNLILTGSLGNVMKESAQAALTYVRANADRYKLDHQLGDKEDLHIHVPAGAIPKDGPSAGVAMMTAMVSLLSQRPLAEDMAMTGEITLRGRVMPVGGIKEKVLAASRAGIKRVILPEKNKKSLDDIPEEIRRKMKFHFAKTADDVVRYALNLKYTQRKS